MPHLAFFLDTGRSSDTLLISPLFNSKRFIVPRRWWLVVVLLALIPAAAGAQEGYNADLLRPSMFGGRYLTFEDARMIAARSWTAGALLGYANAPVDLSVDHHHANPILDDLVTLDLTGGYAVHDMAGLGVAMPLHLFTRGRSFGDVGGGRRATAHESDMALGDLRVAGKVRLVEEGVWPMGVAVTPFVTFPTGDASRLLGEGRITGGATVSYEIDLAWTHFALSGGWQYRGGSEVLGTRVRNGFPLAAGFSRDVWDGLNFSLELHGEAYESQNNRRFPGNPFELDLIGRYPLGGGLRLLVGGGPGLTAGVGSPKFRLVAGVDYLPEPHAVPPPSAGDLRLTVQDDAGQRLEAEIGLEGPELRLGSTSHGVFILTDLAPGTYTVRASRADYETTVAQVNVIAGQVAAQTIVLRKPATRLTIVVLDDHDGVRLPCTIVFNPGGPGELAVTVESGEYSARRDPGSVAFTAEAAGHEAVMTSVEVTPDKITTATVRLRKKLTKRGQIFFDLDSANVRPESNATLDDIAAQIKALHPAHVIIEGHSSNDGPAEHNLDLSRRRAAAVRDYLIARGVDPQWREAQAFGSARPIASNDTDAGRERNRRVEFIIIERD
jgi:outer membrane protein OmpA-like peptidoglycan-associated protein